MNSLFRHHAEALCDDLKAAKVALVRATFVTWAMREGRGDGWISDRTGHLTPEMRSRYARAARTLSDLDYVPFPDVSTTVPELAETPANVVPLGKVRRE